MYISILLSFYGIFLILCGITSVLLIGPKAKTALLSGGMSGALALLIGYFLCDPTTGEATVAASAGIFLSLALFIVFAWRAAKTFFKVLELTAGNAPELKGKAIAFLIIALMAVVSIVVLILQVSNWEFACSN